MRGGLPGARWIDPENYHLTLRFIGDVDDQLAHEVASMLGRVKRGSFELYMEGLTSFGGRKAARGCRQRRARRKLLLDVQAEHERLMQRIGLEPEGRKFTPHVTLARLRESSSQQVAEYLSARGYFRTSRFRVSRFVLFSRAPPLAEARMWSRRATRSARDRSNRVEEPRLHVENGRRDTVRIGGVLRASATEACSAEGRLRRPRCRNRI